MKIVINNCFGGFDLSTWAIERYCELKGLKCCEIDYRCWFVSNEELPEILKRDPDSLSSKEERALYDRMLSTVSFSIYDIPRDDPLLVQVVEEDPSMASGQYASLKVVEIPDDVKWKIHDYDGAESVHEIHRVWR